MNFNITENNNLLSQLAPATMLQQNNNFIERHTDHNAIPTFNSHLKAGTINPLTRKSLKKILNINTKFRDNYTTTSSTNFRVALANPIKKVVSMKLVCAQFPEMVYTFSSKLGSNSFIIDSSNITIPSGSYSSATIVTEINTQLLSSGATQTLSYNENTGLMTFDGSGTSFKLDFNYVDVSCSTLPSNINKDQITLGWMLGFRGDYLNKIESTASGKYYKVRDAQPGLRHNGYLQKNIKCCPALIKNQTDISNSYSGSNSYTGESLFDPHGSRYFLVSVNDYQNNHDNPFISAFQQQSLSDINVLAKVSTECCNKCVEENVERIYFGPTDITKLEIKIFDEFGRIIDINNADYSLTLEFEVIYDL